MYDAIQQAITFGIDAAVAGTIFGLSAELARDLYRFRRERWEAAQAAAIEPNPEVISMTVESVEPAAPEVTVADPWADVAEPIIQPERPEVLPNLVGMPKHPLLAAGPEETSKRKAAKRSRARRVLNKAALISIEQEGKPRFMHPNASERPSGSPKKPLEEMNARELRLEAREKNIAGRSGMNKAALYRALCEEAGIEPKAA